MVRVRAGELALWSARRGLRAARGWSVGCPWGNAPSLQPPVIIWLHQTLPLQSSRNVKLACRFIDEFHSD